MNQLQKKLDELDRQLFNLYEAHVPVCEKLQARHMRRIAAVEEYRRQVVLQDTPFPKVSLEVDILVVL